MRFNAFVTTKKFSPKMRRLYRQNKHGLQHYSVLARSQLTIFQQGRPATEVGYR